MAKRRTGNIYGKGGRWYLRLTLSGGRRRSIALGADEAAARAAAARIVGVLPLDSAEGYEGQLRVMVDLGRWAAAELDRLGAEQATVEPEEAESWTGLWERYAGQSAAAPVTMSSYRRVYDRLRGWCEGRGVVSPSLVTPALVREYLATPAASARAGKYLSTIWRGAGLDAALWPVRVIQTVRQHHRRLTVAEVQGVIDRLRDGSPLARMAADMVVIGWHTGLRLSDVASLTRSHVDGDLLRVRPAKTARVKPRPLIIPLQEESLAVVRRRLEGEAVELFPGGMVAAGAGPVVSSGIARQLRQAFAGLPCEADELASFHGLRASFISQMDEAGVPASITDAITGHAPQTMHGHYAQPQISALWEAVRRAIPPLSR